MPTFSPRLDDPTQYELRAGVPILDVHKRGTRFVDEAKLRLIVENSNRRAAAGELGLLLLGHTTDDGPESAQPPVVGYVRGYRMGFYDGRPCILADLFYDKAEAGRVMKNFPRRSVEVSYSDARPGDNFIDAVACLVRHPERPLGLVTYAAAGRTKERYAMANFEKTAPEGLAPGARPGAAAASLTAEDLPALQDWMKRNSIADMADGIRGFLRAKADGTEQAGADDFDKADIPQYEKYCREHKVPTATIAESALAIERYKKARNAGELYRT